VDATVHLNGAWDNRSKAGTGQLELRVTTESALACEPQLVSAGRYLLFDRGAGCGADVL